MRVLINGVPLLPPNMKEGVSRTLEDLNNVYVDGTLIESHTLQFFGLHPDSGVQKSFDAVMQDQITREAATAASHFKSFFVTHVFDLNNFGQHLYDLMGMTS